jgi:hypothetical protein
MELDNLVFQDANATPTTFSSHTFGGGVIGGNGTATVALTNSTFRDIDVLSNNYFYGGGVIGLYSSGDSVNISALTGNDFQNIEFKIASVGNLAGGGVVGTHNNSGAANIGLLTRNRFTGIEVDVFGLLEGGGVVGSFSYTLSGTANIAGLIDNDFTAIGVKSSNTLNGGGVAGAFSSAGTATFGNLEGNDFDGITVESNILSGGGVVGVGSYNGSSATLGHLVENDFTGIEVKTANSNNLQGGGVVGAYAGSGAATLGNLEHNNFGRITVESSSYIQGGGVVGAHAGSGAATLGNLGYNNFDSIAVEANFLHGGIIGAYAAGTGTATLGNLAENDFTGIEVTANTFLPGSGVVGAYVVGSGTAILGASTGNAFARIKVESPGINGNGVIGAYSNGGTASTGGLEGNDFTDIEVNVTNYLQGSGVVGAYGGGGTATLGALRGNNFTRIKAEADTFNGGGVVGVLAENGATLGALTGSNTFTDITVTADNYLSGGGVVGAYATAGAATLGALAGSNTFTGITVTAGSYFSGGGVIGAYSQNGKASIGALDGNRFTGIAVDAGTLSGGGVVGSHVVSNNEAAIGDLTGNDFRGIDIASDGYLEGGGVVGAFSDGNTAKIGALTGNRFTGIGVTAENFIRGGIVGASSNGAATLTAIGNISGNEFVGNTVTSKSDSILGGLIYARSLGEIVNSSFTGNTFNATNGRVFGAVTLDTSATGSDGNLTIRAKDGGQTVFANTASDSLGMDRQAESLYLGKLSATSARSVILTIDAQLGSLVDLGDPIRVDQDNGQNFTMRILGSGGEFRWGGKNVIDVATGAVTGAINFNKGSRTYLLEGFGLADSSNPVANADVILASGATLLLPVQSDYDLTTVPCIEANSVDVSGLIALDDAPLARIGIAEDDVVLRMENSATVLKKSALGSGTITYGVYDRTYELDWGNGNGIQTSSMQNVVIKTLGAPTYNPSVGASDATTAPGAIADSSLGTDLARNHLRDFFLRGNKEAPGKQLWVDTSFSTTKLRNGNRLGLSYRLETPTLLTGADLVAGEDAVAGVAIGASRPKYWGDSTKLTADETLFMIYGAAALPKGLELSGDIGASFSKYQHGRKVKGEEHKADYRGHNILASLELARPMEIDGYMLRPFVSQDYIRQTVNSYTENGAGYYALKAERQRRDLWVSRLGTEINWQGKETNSGWRFSGSGEAYWQGRFGNTASDTKVRLYNGPDPETYYRSLSEELPRHSLGLGVKANWNLRDRMSIRLGYGLRASRHETTHEGHIRMEWNW